MRSMTRAPRFPDWGTTLEKFEEEMSEEDISALDGLHFHTLCEQDSDDWQRRFRQWKRNSEISAQDEMGEFRRRASHYETWL